MSWAVASLPAVSRRPGAIAPSLLWPLIACSEQQDAADCHHHSRATTGSPCVPAVRSHPWNGPVVSILQMRKLSLRGPVTHWYVARKRSSGRLTSSLCVEPGMPGLSSRAPAVPVADLRPRCSRSGRKWCVPSVLRRTRRQVAHRPWRAGLRDKGSVTVQLVLVGFWAFQRGVTAREQMLLGKKKMSHEYMLTVPN